MKFGVVLALLLALNLALDNIPKIVNSVKVDAAPLNVQTNVCLVMIMKDEVSSFAKLFPSVKNHISGLVACDTGSSDETVHRLETFLNQEQIPGHIAHHSWKNFAHNRNLCLEEAKKWSSAQPRPCEYWLLMDADQEIIADKSFCLTDQKLTDVAYGVSDTAGSVHLYHLRLVSTAVEWMYFGAVHEFIGRVDGQPERGTLLEGLRMLHHTNYDRGWEKDAKMLEESLLEDPNDARTHFYLGNTYFMMKEHEKAVQHYLRRVELGGWAEEQFMAAYHIAELIRAWYEAKEPISPSVEGYLKSWLSLSEGNASGVYFVINAYLAAHALLPYRVEPLVHVAKLYRTELQDRLSCYYYAKMAEALGDFKHDSLFPSVYDYRYGLYDEICVCAWYANKIKEGAAACEKLEYRLTQVQGKPDWKGYMASLLTRTKDNKAYYTKKYEETTLLEAFTHKIGALKERLSVSKPWEITSGSSYIRLADKGIVISAGGGNLLLNAFINMYVLRHQLNCTLPIAVTYWGALEQDFVDPHIMAFIEKHIDAVTFLDVSTLPYPSHHTPLFEPDRPSFNGWKVKAFSVYASPFSDMIFLDSDSMPFMDPTPLFDLPQYQNHGSLFWPDPVCQAPKLHSRLPELNNPWKANPNYHQAESGQFLLNVQQHRDVLEWILMLNSEDKLTYSLCWGDKDLFRVAFDLAGKVGDYQQVEQGPSIPMRVLNESSDEAAQFEDYESRGYIQHHPNGAALFIHRIRGTKYWLNSPEDNRTFTRVALSPSCAWTNLKWRFVGAPTNKQDHSLDNNQVIKYGPANCTYDFMDVWGSVKRCGVEYDYRYALDIRKPAVFEVLPEHHIAKVQGAADEAFHKFQGHFADPQGAATATASSIQETSSKVVPQPSPNRVPHAGMKKEPKSLHNMIQQSNPDLQKLGTGRGCIAWSDCPYSLAQVLNISSAERPEFMSITLTTQLSLDRLDHLGHQCKAWRWQISAAVFLGFDPTAREEAAAVRAIREFAAGMKRKGRCGLDIALYKSIPSNPSSKFNGIYPINALRNKALEVAKTAMVSFVDVDFVPSAVANMDQTEVEKLFDFSKQNHAAIVMPCFEPKDSTDMTKIPLVQKSVFIGKNFVKEEYGQGELVWGAYNVWQEAHNVTDYPRWMTATTPYQVKFKLDYEPFVILRNEEAPWFDERFAGCGGDKQTYLVALAGWDFQLWVHPELYLVALPHERTPESQERGWWDKPGHWRRAMADFYWAMVDDEIGLREEAREQSRNVYRPRKCDCS